MIPIILSGGSGSRLWPLSRAQFPKQFLRLTGQYSLFQETLRRLPDELQGKPAIICNADHRFHIREQLTELGIVPSFQILEPFGRNTAPAVALAAMHVLAEGDDELMLVLPADHLIRETEVYHQALTHAQVLATSGKLVLFGVRPSRPETGYGYIRCDAEHACSETAAMQVISFHEKPDAETARTFVEAGAYFWNSGMFVFRASVYLDELRKHQPDIFSACEHAYRQSHRNGGNLHVDPKAFSLCTDQSIDYAVMEKTDRAVVVPLDASWSDVGCWHSLWEVSEKDAQGNALQGDVLARDTENCHVYGSKRLISLIGVRNLVVVDTPDALLIADKSSSQDVKRVVQTLASQGRPETQLHREVKRPWGAYDSIDQGPRFQVKRIRVNPGQSLSLQKHHHRAEHWIVVKGTAMVTCDDKEFMLSENQSTYIPIGSVHRLSNPGKIPLELIEVQTGSYLGEDDIVRLEDSYGRTGEPEKTAPEPGNLTVTMT